MTAAEVYERDLIAMLEAARTWAAHHRDVKLRFRRLGTSPVVGPLSGRVIQQVAGNAITRSLLLALKGAASAATILQAEAAIEEVYGIRRALTEALH